MREKKRAKLISNFLSFVQNIMIMDLIVVIIWIYSFFHHHIYTSHLKLIALFEMRAAEREAKKIAIRALVYCDDSWFDELEQILAQCVYVSGNFCVFLGVFDWNCTKWCYEWVIWWSWQGNCKSSIRIGTLEIRWDK